MRKNHLGIQVLIAIYKGFDYSKHMQNFPTIKPDWPTPPKVKAFTTTRQSGFSLGAYASFNLGMHVDDDVQHVQQNRSLLLKACKLPDEPIWLNQTHSAIVVNAENLATNPADAIYSFKPNLVCAILTADCLPVLLCDKDAKCVAAIHAGWRGLAAGIIENTVAALNIPAANIMAWLGPAISAENYEVGEEVREQFVAHDKDATSAFTPNKNQKWQMDIYALAKQRLTQCNVTQIYGGNFCTYQQKDLFYSHRRDKISGRMASLIWLQPEE